MKLLPSCTVSCLRGMLEEAIELLRGGDQHAYLFGRTRVDMQEAVELYESLHSTDDREHVRIIIREPEDETATMATEATRTRRRPVGTVLLVGHDSMASDRLSPLLAAAGLGSMSLLDLADRTTGTAD